ncbi:MAG: hypothetical protein H6619_04130 [Deltaproteobacteria bacterium]|nr:hypothetical protein [Deltaproteobacteria bacterium]
MKDDFLDERIRAQDILLGALGFGEEASILSLEPTEDGYRGIGAWEDGEQFEFESEESLTDLERWAISILS